MANTVHITFKVLDNDYECDCFVEFIEICYACAHVFLFQDYWTVSV